MNVITNEIIQLSESVLRQWRQEEIVLLAALEETGAEWEQRVVDLLTVASRTHWVGVMPDLRRIPLERVRHMRPVMRSVATIHGMARELLAGVGLPTRWSQGVSNQLMMQRLGVEERLVQLAQAEWVHVEVGIHLAARRGGQRMDVVAAVLRRVRGWSRQANRLVLDGRMACLRTLIHLVGEAERCERFYYAGPRCVESRPFCQERVGRLFGRDEVVAWERLTWSGQERRDTLWAWCGGAGCHHVLLPVPNTFLWPRAPPVTLCATPFAHGSPAGAHHVKRYWNPDDPVGMWHEVAFGHAPHEVRQAVGRAGIPEGGVRTSPDQTRMQFVLERGVAHIDMGVMRDQSRGGRLDQLLWRHEFGHYLDYSYGKLYNQMWSCHDAKMRRALWMDGQAVMLRAGVIGREPWRMRTMLATNRLVAQLWHEMEQRSGAAAIVWLVEQLHPFGLALDRVEQALIQDAGYAGVVADPWHLVVLLAAWQRRDSLLLGEHVLQWRRPGQERMGMAMTLADLFGALTVNRIGFGHSDRYYRQDPARRGSEVFANSLVLLGDGNPFWGQLLQRFAPRIHACLVAALAWSGQADARQADSRSQAVR
ncbi:MAG: hypothetical protein G8237_13855 [Magnetococcales bacterium]|nr:hypothetical protein [Magnetococcales bacterium]